MGEQLWRQHEYLRRRAHRTIQTAIRASGSARLTLEVGALRRYDAALDPFVLRDLMERVGLEMVPRPGTVERFTQLRSGSDGQASGTVEQGELVIIRSKGEIAVARRGVARLPRRPAVKIPRDGEIAAPGAVHLKTQVRETAAPLSGNDRVCAQFDCDHLRGQLSLRSPEAGDRYRPIGLNGSKKLADLLADRGVPVFERPDVPVLTDEAGILWPIGHPIAERAKITARTRRVLVAQVVREGR
ncbi:MAG: tRNA lysidine(34) synthetase TilS [candidate division Zixibacteria bacterium]|nr:tRNA lysidine(34) synthetase TilS [candidate division Zixibacteria bacterium]